MMFHTLKTLNFVGSVQATTGEGVSHAYALRAAFDHELRNHMMVMPIEEQDNNWCIVRDYLKTRIAELTAEIERG